ncbi:MAG: glutamine-hydrolyzing carbamoyl-phosphate synthase small subunit [Candidatus Firestonebacteria bacterium]|nr:glutamine-hydrolyzing carbamoyl-phosphate synthase small subunit [Candidatus Firestonebacteria bacterium]
MKAYIMLEDGSFYEGRVFGSYGEVTGEVVFNTCMSGYQEILTDPSYHGQIVTMTYPLIGNYGINPEDVESRKIFARGLLVKEYSKIYSNWRAKKSLGEYLKENNIIGIEGIDTRSITRHIRIRGAMRGIISSIDNSKDSLLEKVRNSPGLVGCDLVKEVTGEPKTVWKGEETPKYKVVAYDFGIKYNIIRKLVSNGCEVILVNALTSAEEVLSYNPDGIFLSNGPGDPAAVSYAIKNVKELLGKKPIFGICLGHQIIALAMGCNTYKLKFGHRGGNHPVKNLITQKVEITSQNHGFAVDTDSIKGKNIELTHLNLNDHTVEGIKHNKIPIFSVQYHPESSPGPHDSQYLFEEFNKLMGET